MKAVIAIDSFKGSIGSHEAGKAVSRGIIKACKENCVSRVFSVSDGGEGCVDALCALTGKIRSSLVTGPLGEKVEAKWGIVTTPSGDTAVIEMSSAAGIALVRKEELNPLYTTTFGVGEIIKEAIEEGYRRFIIGIGGSCTNDGGAGMLQALGYNLNDSDSKPISAGAIGLRDLASISDKEVLDEFRECTFRIACDVKNPLCGENGCSAIYGPQKGATPEMIRDMDKWLKEYAKLTENYVIERNKTGASQNSEASRYAHSDEYPGAGAAGGMGYAFHTFLNATLESGINLILDEIGIENEIADSDIVITGEGRMDCQTVMGKVPVGVAHLAKKYGKKVIAFCGCATEDAGVCNEYGIDAYFPIVRDVASREEAMKPENTLKNLELTAEQVFRALCALEEQR